MSVGTYEYITWRTPRPPDCPLTEPAFGYLETRTYALQERAVKLRRARVRSLVHRKRLQARRRGEHGVQCADAADRGRA